jgi:hypothetical protein
VDEGDGGDIKHSIHLLSTPYTRVGARWFMIEMVESRHLPREHTYKFVKDLI